MANDHFPSGQSVSSPAVVRILHWKQTDKGEELKTVTSNTPRLTSLIFSVLLLLLATFMVGPVVRAQSTTLRVPTGKHVLIDGKVEANEWRDAVKLKASDDFELYLKQSSGFLYLALRPTAPKRFGVNLYFGKNEKAPFLNMHASAKLGQRELGENEVNSANWPEWKTWWNNRGWTANVVRPDNFASRTFLDEEGKEFQIKLDTLGVKRLSLAVDLEMREGPRDLLLSAPEKHGKHWIMLKL
jgi:hypothetical protein